MNGCWGNGGVRDRGFSGPGCRNAGCLPAQMGTLNCVRRGAKLVILKVILKVPGHALCTNLF